MVTIPKLIDATIQLVELWLLNVSAATIRLHVHPIPMQHRGCAPFEVPADPERLQKRGESKSVSSIN